MNKTIIADLTNPSLSHLQEVAEVLGVDGLVVFPSDTVLGLMAKIGTKTIGKVDSFKLRTNEKNYSLICSDIIQLKQYVRLENQVLDQIKTNLEGLFTFVVEPKEVLRPEISLILSGTGKLGFRIPKSQFMRRLAKLCPYPLLATSANISGQPSVYTLDELREQNAKINHIDLIVQSKLANFKKNPASTVVDLSNNSEILRQGNSTIKI